MKRFAISSLILALGFLPCASALAATAVDAMPPSLLTKGSAEGVGTRFEVKDSEYLNITVESAETIKLRLDSVPKTVVMHIEPVSQAVSTQIVLRGFQSSTVYYKYEDAYYNLETFTTHPDGSYAYTQDLSSPHTVFIQPHKSTYFIGDDGKGGNCSLIGTWNEPTKTCTLTTDVFGAIQIYSPNITLDGNGHTVTGAGEGAGINMIAYPRSEGITVRNLTVKNFAIGIWLGGGTNNTISNVTVSGNSNNGIEVWYTTNTTLTNNRVLNNRYGIEIGSSSNIVLTENRGESNEIGIYLSLSTRSTLRRNTVQENSFADLYIGVNSDDHCDNVIENTTGSGGRPIEYLNSSGTIEGATLAGLILCNADGATINNVIIDGSATLKNNGIILFRTDSASITNTISSNNNSGIWLFESSNNVLTGNTFANDVSGIVVFDRSSGNVLVDNVISGCNFGVDIGYGSSNQIYSNSFLNNRIQAHDHGSGNIFNLPKPIGGNYWSNFDEPSEGCFDSDYDGFCDSPYSFFRGGADYLPLTTQRPSDSLPPATTPTVSGQPGENGWYVSTVRIELTALDNEGGSGVKEIHYSIDGLETVAPGGWVSFEIIAEGRHTITYYAVDNAGNAEAEHTINIYIDMTAPHVTLSANPVVLWPPNHKMVDVDIIGGAIDSISDVAEIAFSVIDEYGIVQPTVKGFQTAIPLEAWRDGTDKDGRHYTISVLITDRAGNQSTASTTVLVPHDLR